MKLNSTRAGRRESMTKERYEEGVIVEIKGKRMELI